MDKESILEEKLNKLIKKPKIAYRKPKFSKRKKDIAVRDMSYAERVTQNAYRKKPFGIWGNAA